MSAGLSPTFRADLARVYATLGPQTLSAAFLSDLEKVYATLPVLSDANLQFLSNRFDKWHRLTQELVRTRLAELDKDDPLLCCISLFRTMDAGRLEVAHTRTLAWLLDPEREHGFGQTLLAALLRRLSGDAFSNALRVERVESEFPIDGSGAKGRLDVLAEGTWGDGERGGWVLVIEAKVDAGEGEGQLDMYDEWLRRYAADRKRYRIFLTPDGRPPETPDGRAPETGTEEEAWEPLSFLDLVRIFRTAYGGLRHKPGFHFLRFYLAGVLQDICGWPRNTTTNARDSYAVASYLKTVHDFHSEGASHDTAR